jgi:nucleoside-diphosphate-sugar epimerase
MSVRTNTALLAKEFAGQNILITGAGGFVGRHLVKAFQNVSVTNLVLVDLCPTESIGGLWEKYVILDLRDKEQVERFGKKYCFDTVFHLAGKIDHSIRPGVYQEQFKTHFEATLNLLDAVSAKDLRIFVCVGSNAEYGNAQCPHSETTREMPNSAYGVSKLAASRLVLAKVASEGIPAVVVRPFLIYGKGQIKQSFLQMALEAAFVGHDFPTTACEQTRDFVSVEKVVSDLLTVASTRIEPGRIFNICTGVETKLKDVLMLIKQHYPAFNPLIGQIPYRKNELMRSVGVPYAAIPKEQAIQELSDFIAQTKQANVA